MVVLYESTVSAIARRYKLARSISLFREKEKDKKKEKSQIPKKYVYTPIFITFTRSISCDRSLIDSGPSVSARCCFDYSFIRIG